VPYEEPARKEGAEAVSAFFWKGGNKNFPLRAPPAISRGDFTLCNTPVVVIYLGRKFGLMPTTGEDDVAHCESIVTIVADAVGEGRLAFHPLNHYASHKGQEEASVQHVQRYGEQRLPKYLAYFEDILSKNPHGSMFLVGDRLTVADLQVFQYCLAAEQHYKQWYAPEIKKAPLLSALVDAVAQRPNIKAYLASDRVFPWDSDSMM